MAQFSSLRTLASNIITNARFYLTSRHTSHRLILSLIHTFITIWACIVSFTYSGCLESELLCPQAYFTVPLTSFSFYIFTELPLLIAAIVISAVNITAMFALGTISRFHYILAAVALGIFLFSTVFITSYVRFGDALQQEINRLQQEGELIP